MNPHSDFQWISQLGEGLTGRGARPPPLSSALKVSHLSPPPRPASGLLPRPSGAGAVRGDMRLAEGQEQEKTKGLGLATVWETQSRSTAKV